VTPFSDTRVQAVFDNYPEFSRPHMLALRRLVFEVAAELPEVGRLEETLKWGEPAYLTPVTRSGTTIRMDWKSRAPEVCAVYFNCQTTLVDTFRSLFPDVFSFEGNRALLMPLDRPLPEDAVKTCIAAALTYHLNKA
jgi:hypothetical protein